MWLNANRLTRCLSGPADLHQAQVKREVKIGFEGELENKKVSEKTTETDSSIPDGAAEQKPSKIEAASEEGHSGIRLRPINKVPNSNSYLVNRGDEILKIDRSYYAAPELNSHRSSISKPRFHPTDLSLVNLIELIGVPAFDTKVPLAAEEDYSDGFELADDKVNNFERDKENAARTQEERQRAGCEHKKKATQLKNKSFRHRLEKSLSSIARSTSKAAKKLTKYK